MLPEVWTDNPGLCALLVGPALPPPKQGTGKAGHHSGSCPNCMSRRPSLWIPTVPFDAAPQAHLCWDVWRGSPTVEGEVATIDRTLGPSGKLRVAGTAAASCSQALSAGLAPANHRRASAAARLDCAMTAMGRARIAGRHTRVAARPLATPPAWDGWLVMGWARWQSRPGQGAVFEAGPLVACADHVLAAPPGLQPLPGRRHIRDGRGAAAPIKPQRQS